MEKEPSKDRNLVLSTEQPAPMFAPSQEKLGLGLRGRPWLGTELSRVNGVEPPGYTSPPGWVIWRKHIDHGGVFTFGPYLEVLQDGVLEEVVFAMDLTERGGSGDPVLKCDIVDYHGRLDPIEAVFHVSDFPENSQGFCIYLQRSVAVQRDMLLEFRTHALGGATLRLFMLTASILYP